LQREVNGEWVKFHSGKKIGEDEVLTFPPVVAQRVRLDVLKASNSLSISEFELYATAGSKAKK
jgi:hypothetical protein